MSFIGICHIPFRTLKIDFRSTCNNTHVTIIHFLRIASQISQDLVTPTAAKPPELVIDKEKEAAMLALLEKAKTALVGNKTKVPDSSSPSPEDDATEIETAPPAEQSLPDTQPTEGEVKLEPRVNSNRQNGHSRSGKLSRKY